MPQPELHRSKHPFAGILCVRDYLMALMGTLDWSTAFFLGAVTIRMPSEDRLETTLAGSESVGRVHFWLNCFMTADDPKARTFLVSLESSTLASCLPSMLRTLLTVKVHQVNAHKNISMGFCVCV